MYEDRCMQCGLQLRQCPACQGVAGPFDRYCGFCGHYLAAGEPRSPAWRLWLLVAMVPLVAGLAFGLSPYSAPVAARVGSAVFRPLQHPSPTPAPTPSGTNYRVQNLHLEYVNPADWAPPSDYTLARTPIQQAVLARMAADNAAYAATNGDLLAEKPTGAVVTLGDPGPAPAGVDPADPSSVLGAEVSQLSLQPPAGYSTVEVVKPATTTSVDNRPAKVAVLKLTRSDGSVYYFERVLVSGPSSLFKVDALVPAADWTAGDSARVDAIVNSIRLTG
jgi:hypothetical protein